MSMLNNTTDRHIVVDATGHIVGKLASKIAKKLLEGYTVAVVACENAIFTGPLERHILKYKAWKQKRCVVNPQRGAFHYKEPSKYFFKVLRTMVQRKTNRGGEALRRLTCYEGIPHNIVFNNSNVCCNDSKVCKDNNCGSNTCCKDNNVCNASVSNMVMFPSALKKVTTNPERKSCTIGELLSKFGWKHAKLAKQMYENALRKEKEAMETKENKNKEIKKIMDSNEFKQKVEAELALLK